MTPDLVQNRDRPGPAQGSDGFAVRGCRVLNTDGPTIIAALDAPVFQGPTGGLRNSLKLVEELIDGGIDGILAFPGFHRRYVPPTARIGRIVNITASSTFDEPTRKVPIAGPNLIHQLGADAAGIHLNLAAEVGATNLQTVGCLVSDCHLAAIPALVAAYTPGQDFNEYPEASVHAARAAADLGATIVKVPPLADVGALATLVEVVAPTDVLVAGGPVASQDEALQIAARARDAGAAGLCFGRALFEHPSPRSLAENLRHVLRND